MADTGAGPTTREERRRSDEDLWEIFRAKEDAGELLLYRSVFLIALFGNLLPTISSALSGNPERNVPFFLITTLCTAWFGIAALLRSREIAVAPIRAATIIVFALIPWSLMAAYVWLLGILRAIGVWEPVMFFTALCVLSIIWARPAIPLTFGVTGAAAYLGLWIWTTPPSTWSALPDNSPLFAHITIYRAILLLFVGVLSWWGARHFRSVVLSGARALRARDLFGKYRLHDAIGHGGMGSVVKATYCPEGGFERPVAIKRVLPHIASRPSVVAQFRAEAKLGSRLVHPNIVPVLDFGRIDETYFFAMEYVDGPSLQEVLSRARRVGLQLPGGFVARVGLDVCRALTFAHEEAVDADGHPLRVVHRDLCPANILIARAGTTKLTDFGIARVLGDAEAEQTSTVVGKVAYMAPELLTRASFDARADLFSFGVILWEMLTGQHLFQRSRHGAAALAIAEENVPPPTQENPDLDPAWDEICARLLEREADDRYANAAEVADALIERLRIEGEAEGEVRQVLQRLEDSSGQFAERAYADDDVIGQVGDTVATQPTEVTQGHTELTPNPADITSGEAFAGRERE